MLPHNQSLPGIRSIDLRAFKVTYLILCLMKQKVKENIQMINRDMFETETDKQSMFT